MKILPIGWSEGQSQFHSDDHKFFVVGQGESWTLFEYGENAGVELHRGDFTSAEAAMRAAYPNQVELGELTSIGDPAMNTVVGGGFSAQLVQEYFRFDSQGIVRDDKPAVFSLNLAQPLSGLTTPLQFSPEQLAITDVKTKADSRRELLRKYMSHPLYHHDVYDERVFTVDLKHLVPETVFVIKCNDSVEAVFMGTEAKAEKMKDILRTQYADRMLKQLGPVELERHMQQLFWRVTLPINLYTEVPGGETSQDPAKDLPG